MGELLIDINETTGQGGVFSTFISSEDHLSKTGLCQCESCEIFFFFPDCASYFFTEVNIFPDDKGDDLPILFFHSFIHPMVNILGGD